MKLGVVVRNMGPQSTRESLLACAKLAEQADLDDVWVVDHVAIPPEDAEGSGGRYLDPLATLAFLSGATERIGLGTGVLILPYRPPLPTAKWIATLQELSVGRLRLGVGVGWMKPEFRALGVDRSRRGTLADEALEFLHRCFAEDVAVAHGQRFLFLPRPARPPIFVGGASPQALDRVLRFGDGWMPMGLDPAKLRGPISELRRRAGEGGRLAPEVVAMGSLPLSDAARAADELLVLEEAGVTHVVHAERYGDAAAFGKAVEGLAGLRRGGGTGSSPSRDGARQ